MLLNNRIIFKDNATLLDKSVDLSNVFSGTVSTVIVALEDALFIGSDLPFNHRYIQIGTANSNSCTITVSVWDGSTFNAVVDGFDQTSGFTTSGILSWVKDTSQSWGQEQSTETVTGLTTLKIYDLYWVKLTFSANMSAGTTLKYVGHKFCEDADLGGYYPDLILSATKTAFSSGKTDWTEQEVLASEEIISDLRKKKFIWSDSQILDWNIFNLACVHKTAEIIFRAFGDDYKDNLIEANKQYHKAMSGLDFNVDTNEDGELDEAEKFRVSGMFRR